MTIVEAFRELTSRRCWYKPHGITRQRAHDVTAADRRGKLSDVTRRTILEQCGWTCSEEWRDASI